MDIKEQIKIFCTNLKSLRKRNGLTYDEMAKILKISPENLEMVENGIFPDDVPFDIVFYIQRHFGVSVQMIFKELI